MFSSTPVPPLHALVAFEALVRQGTAARALRELGVSKAALAGSVALLEERTGLHLFVRHTPVVELTAEGLAYYHAVAAFARGIADALHRLGAHIGTEIRIAATPGVARLWLASQLETIRASCAGVAFKVAVSESLSDLERSECDIALRYCHPDEYDEECHVLWRESLAVFAPGTQSGGLGLRALSDLLANEPLIEHPSFSWSRVAAHIGLAALPRAPGLVCHDLYAILLACARGEGLALLPEHLTRGMCARLRLVPVNACRLDAKPYALLYSASGRARPVVRDCARIIVGLAAQLQPDVAGGEAGPQHPHADASA